jgi:hypothetical protein
MSTLLTASILGRGGSMPKRRGGSPLWTQRQNFRSSRFQPDSNAMATSLTVSPQSGFPRQGGNVLGKDDSVQGHQNGLKLISQIMRNRSIASGPFR